MGNSIKSSSEMMIYTDSHVPAKDFICISFLFLNYYVWQNTHLPPESLTDSNPLKSNEFGFSFF